MTTNTLLIADYSTNSSNGTFTFFEALNGGDDVGETTETQVQTTMREAGVGSKLSIRASANTLTNDGNMRTRKNAANASQTITITKNVTGNFTDAVNTDTISAGEKWNYTQTQTGGALTPDTYSMLFAATTDTVTKNSTHWSFNLTVASTTSFGPIGGKCTASNTTEANEKCRMRKAGVMKNLSANVITNGRAQASTMKGRLNGADGTVTAAITGSTTGIFEDSTHSDTIAVGNDYNLANVTGSSTGTLAYRPVATSFVSTASFGMASGGTSASRTQLINITRFYKYCSTMLAITTENDTVKVRANEAFTLSELTIFVNTNTVTADSTLTSRKNAGAGGLTTTITNATTGVFSDSSNTEVETSTDDINTQLVTGATGTSLLFVQLTVWTTVAAAAATTARPNPRAFGVDVGSKYGSLNMGNVMAVMQGNTNQGGAMFG